MTTEERLAKVERELGRVKRRSHWLLAALGLGLGALALVWASAASVPSAEAQGSVGGRTVRANEFILEDERGMVRAMLQVAKFGPVLRLYDAAGKPRAALGVDADGPMLTLLDENGTGRVVLDVDKGGARLDLFDVAGKPRAILSVMNERGPVLVMNDAAGKPRAGLKVDMDRPGLDLFGADGKVIWATGGADGVTTTPRQVTSPVKAAPPAAPPLGSRICPDCNGTGRLTVRSSPPGLVTMTRRCESCKGTGKITSPVTRLEDENRVPSAPPPPLKPPGLGICPGCNQDFASTRPWHHESVSESC